MDIEVRQVTVPRTIRVNDKLHFEDKVLYAKENGPQATPHSGMWARTEVIGGFGDFVKAQSPFGINRCFLARGEHGCYRWRTVHNGTDLW